MHTVQSALARELAHEPPTIPVGRVAELAGVSKRNVFRWIEQGRLKSCKTHPDAKRGRTLVLKSSLIELLGGAA